MKILAKKPIIWLLIGIAILSLQQNNTENQYLVKRKIKARPSEKNLFKSGTISSFYQKAKVAKTPCNIFSISEKFDDEILRRT